MPGFTAKQLWNTMPIVIYIMPVFAFAHDAPDLLGDCTHDSVVAYITGGDPDASYSEGDMAPVVEKCGSDALAPLEEVLKDSSMPHLVRGRAALCIGLIGVPAGTEPLIRYVQHSRTDQPISVNEYTSMKLAMHSLGFIGSDRAIAFLKLLCTEDYWLNRSDVAMLAPDIDASDGGWRGATIVQWRRSALAGIATMESTEALEVLTELRREGAADDILHAIDRSIFNIEKHIAERMVEDEGGDRPSQVVVP